MTLSQIAEIIASKTVREINDENTSVQSAMALFTGVSLLLTRMYNRREINSTKYDYCISILTYVMSNKERGYNNE